MQKKRLIDCLSVQSYSGATGQMMDYIYGFVDEHVPNAVVVTDKDNIYVTKGEADIYPCVVAHTDTVHDIISDFRVIESDGILFAMDMKKVEQTGIGGDDKVGIFIALECLIKHDAIKVVFFRDEETGCEGSSEANMDFFADVAFVLQCDRRGYKDIASDIYGHEMYNKAFSDKIAPVLYDWGRKEVSGAMTDVYQLALNGLEVCMANLSCGYYNPHTETEFVIIIDVMDTLELVHEIIEVCGGERWTIKRDKVHYPKQYWGGYGHAGELEGGEINLTFCKHCFDTLHTKEEQEYGVCYSCIYEELEQEERG